MQAETHKGFETHCEFGHGIVSMSAKHAVSTQHAANVAKLQPKQHCNGCVHTQDAEQDLQAEDERAAERAALDSAARGPAQQLASTLINLRSWQVGKPQLSLGDSLLDKDLTTCKQLLA